MNGEHDAQHHLPLARYRSIIAVPLHLILAMRIETATSKLELRAITFAVEIHMNNLSRLSRLGTEVGGR